MYGTMYILDLIVKY